MAISLNRFIQLPDKIRTPMSLLAKLKTGLAALATLLIPSLALAKGSGFTSVFNMPKGISEVSQSIYDIHMIVFWVCVAIGAIVFTAMFVIMWLHRKSRGHEAAQFHDNAIAETIWTIIPVIILVGLAIPATTIIIDSYDTSNPELEIKITGSQWKWQYEYLGKGVKFISELATPQDEIQNQAPKGQYYLQEVTEPLVIPVDTKVVFKMTSGDVIHAWWVPDFAVKKDAIPGYITEAWVKAKQTGIYFGSCAELCGKNHAFMPVVVKVIEKNEFNPWLDKKKEEASQLRELVKQTASMDDMMQRGKAVYERSCASCHGITGKGIPGAFPSLVGTSIVLGAKDDHIDIVVNGKGIIMQAFGDQLNEVDLAAVITYERNAWGNATKDLIQPIDIFNFKSSK